MDKLLDKQNSTGLLLLLLHMKQQYTVQRGLLLGLKKE